MLIKHTKTQKDPTFTVNSVKINRVHHYEYLGFFLDDKLSMNDYTDVMWKKANCKIGIL